MTGDSLPPKLIKFFTEQAHAELFSKEGKVRLRIQKYFMETEDATRADESEGKSALRIPSDSVTQINMNTGAATQKPGILEYAGVDLNPTFIYCMALPEVDMDSRLKIWPYYVEIIDPGDFAADLAESIGRHTPAGHQVLWFEFVRVIYNKGTLIADPGPEARARLSYAQKPPRFVPECECRFVIKLDVVAEPARDEFVDVQLSRHKKYSRPVATTKNGIA